MIRGVRRRHGIVDLRINERDSELLSHDLCQPLKRLQGGIVYTTLDSGDLRKSGTGQFGQLVLGQAMIQPVLEHLTRDLTGHTQRIVRAPVFGIGRCTPPSSRGNRLAWRTGIDKYSVTLDHRSLLFAFSYAR